jgi:hypothetical protein
VREKVKESDRVKEIDRIKREIKREEIYDLYSHLDN